MPPQPTLSASRQTMTANRVAPSISAAVMIMAVLIWPAASGWRAIDSTALPPMRPMPARAAHDHQAGADRAAQMGRAPAVRK